jgi:hypothetical protein
MTGGVIYLSVHVFYVTGSAEVSSGTVKWVAGPANRFAGLMKVSQPMWKSRQGMIYASHSLREKRQSMRKK